LNNQPERAEEFLDKCPKALRHWEWHYLKRLCHSELLTLPLEGQASLNCLQFSPNGGRLVAGGEDGLVKIWDATSGREIRTLRGHTFPILGVAFSPDGKRLASAAGNRENNQDGVRKPTVGELKLWNPDTGEEILPLRGHTDSVNGVAFSPDGKYLASTGTDRTVRVWDALTGKELSTLKGHSEMVLVVAFSPDGQYLASGGMDGAVKIWGAASGKEVVTLPGDSKCITSLAFDKDSRHLASVGLDQTVKLWDLESRKLARTFDARPDGFQLAFSPDGKLLAAAGSETIRVWDPANGRVLHTIRGAGGLVVFCPVGNRLASLGKGGIQIWENLKDQRAIAYPSPASVNAVAFQPPHGRMLASTTWGFAEGELRVWDPTNGKKLLSLPCSNKTNVDFSPDGRRLAYQDKDSTLKVLDMPTGKLSMNLGKGPLMAGHSGAFRPDGKRFASASGNVVTVYDITDGKLCFTIPQAHQFSIFTLAFSPDSKYLATASGEFMFSGEVKLWDTATEKLVRRFEGPKGWVYRVAFCPDGKLLAAASSSGLVTVWDTNTGQTVYTLRGHTDQVRDVQFSTDGKRLVTACQDRTVKIWNAANGEETVTLRGHTDMVNCAVFSPDGHWIASCAGSMFNRGEVRIWNATPLRESRAP
jgi:WD40 repeat protein